MIVGHGDVASVLPDNPERLYFASGVSNSSETRPEEFMREVRLLEEQPRNRRLVYFSSLAVFYSHTPYAKHKRNMEELVKFRFPEYTIIRLGNISWGTNPHTIINFMRAKVARGEAVEIRQTYRYVIGKEEFLHWIERIPDFNCEMNLTGERMTVRELYERYVLNQ